MTVNGEPGGMWKVGVVAYFKALPLNSPAGTEKTTKHLKQDSLSLTSIQTRYIPNVSQILQYNPIFA